MGLRHRLTLLFAVAVALLAVAGGSLLVQQLSAGMDQALDRSLTVRADALAQQVGPDGTVVDFQDGSGALGLLSPTQSLAQVIGPTGTVVETSQGAGSAPLLTAAQLTHARAAVVAVTTTLPDATQARLVAVPVPDSGMPPAVVVVGTSRQVVLAAVDRVQTAAWIGGPLTVALGAVGSWLVAGAVLRPVERMRAQAAAISAGDGDARLAVPDGRDEIARLGHTINALLGRLQRALAQQTAFVADAGHELRTPLTALRAELELAGRPGRDRASLAAAVHAASEDTDRLIRLAEDLLTLAQADHAPIPLRRELVDVDTVVAEAAAAARTSARAKDVQIDVGAGARGLVPGDRDRLRQIVDNLLDNALRHTPAGSTVTARATRTATGTVVIQVRDQGPGFPPDFLARAFDRFTRADHARPDGPGTGLGLAIVASLVAAHAGAVSARNDPGGGADVRVELPRGPHQHEGPGENAPLM
jgi:signal transduction histidine kinase